MIESAHGTVESLARDLGVSRRLAARLGALAARGVFFSRAIAAEAGPGTPWERLLARRDWLETDPAAVLETLRGESGEPADLLRDWPLVLIERDGGRLLALRDELDAEAAEAAANPLAASPAPCPPPVPAHFSAAPAVRPSRDADVGAGAWSAPPFPSPDAELASLRVTVFAGQTAEEKIAALRRIAFLACPADVKIALFLQVLADADTLLRSAAAQGLGALGLDADLAAACQLLADGQPSERERAADRLADLASGARGYAADALLAALLGALRRPDAGDAEAERLYDALTRSAPLLGFDALARSAVADVLLAGLLSVPAARLAALRRTLAAVDAAAPGWVAGRLADDFLRSRSPEYRARLLPLLAGLPIDCDRRRRLTPLAADLLLAVPADSDACRHAGRFVLARGGEDGLVELADRMIHADAAHQRHLVRLLDNAARECAGLSAGAATRLARAGLALLKGGARSVRIDLLETRLVAGPGIDPSTAAEIADALAADLPDYAHWRLLENVVDIFASLGWPAVPPLARVLRENAAAPESWAAAAALGRIGEAEGASTEGEGPARAAECLRLLQVAGFVPGPHRDAVHAALGRAASASAAAPEAVDLVFRTLWRRLSGAPADRALFEGLGWAASGPGATDAARTQLAERLLERWRAPAPAPAIRRSVRPDGEEVFDFDEELTAYSLCWIACLDALERLARSPAAAPELRENILAGLLEGWRAGGGGGAPWGPANAARLTAALGRLGAAPNCDPAARSRIAHALALRRADPASAAAAADLLAAPGPPDAALDRLAGALALQVLKTLSEAPDLTPEDREFWLAVLARLGRRPRFETRGDGDERLRERLVEALAGGARSGISACRRRLEELCGLGALRGRALERAGEELARARALTAR